MKLEGTKEFDASRAVVWSVINYLVAMARTMPGVESFEIADDTHWSAKVKVPLGLGGLKDVDRLQRSSRSGRSSSRCSTRRGRASAR